MNLRAEWALLVVIGLAAGGCGGGGGGSDDSTPPPPRVLVGLALSPPSWFLVPDDTVTLSVVGYFSYGPDAPVAVTWSSDNEPAATVVSSGQVTAVAAGQAVITATSVDDPTIQQTADIEVIDWSTATVYGFDNSMGLRSYPTSGGPAAAVSLTGDPIFWDVRGICVVSDAIYAVAGPYLYHIDLSSSVVSELHTFDSTVLSITADDSGRLYVAIHGDAAAPSSEIWRYESPMPAYYATVPVHAAIMVGDGSGNIYAADNGFGSPPSWIVRVPVGGGVPEIPTPSKVAWCGGMDLAPGGRTIFAMDIVPADILRYDDFDGDGYFESQATVWSAFPDYDQYGAIMFGLCWVGSGLLINDAGGAIFHFVPGGATTEWSTPGLDNGSNHQTLDVGP